MKALLGSAASVEHGQSVAAVTASQQPQILSELRTTEGHRARQRGASSCLLGQQDSWGTGWLSSYLSELLG